MFSTKEECKDNIKTNYHFDYGYKADMDFAISWDELYRRVYENFPTKFKKYKKIKKREAYSKLYETIDMEALHNTLQYLFFKIGGDKVFVLIMDNKIEKFIPFNNVSFRNDWTNDKNIELSDVRNIYNKIGKNPRNLKKIKYWRANGCLLSMDKPYDLDLSDLAINIYKNLFEELVKEKKVNDTMFFINRNDFPILNNDLTEPFNQIYGDNVPLPRKYQFTKFVPILSVSTHKKSAVIPIPTYDDWLVVTEKYFTPSCNNSYLPNFTIIPWNNKKNIAIFRGSATGCGVNVNTNPRLKLSKIAENREDLDIGITRDIKRLKWYKGRVVYTDIEKEGIKKAAPIPMAEQSEYKYIFDIEGNSIAFRFPFLLSSGSLIYRVESEWSLWIDQYIKDKKEYILIDREYKNLDIIMEWCKNNDRACQRIAENSQKAFKKYVNKKFIFKYIVDILDQISLYIDI